MKSTMSTEVSSEVPNYPYFGKWPDGTLIVLFTAPRRGCVVHDENNLRLGEYGNGSWKEEEFTRWNGSVTITA